MDNLSVKELQQRIKDLEKQNRLLRKKLERSEANRVALENTYEIQSKLVNQVIQGLEKSQAEAQTRSQELEEAFNNLQMMQAKLVESEKMSALGMLVAGIAHEINNPMSFIAANISYAYTYVQKLIDLLNLYQEVYPQPDSKVTDLVKDIELEFLVQDLFKLLNSMQIGSDRICKIVLGLRTFSRLDEAEYKAADLHEGLDSTLMLLQHRLKSAGAHPSITVVKHYGQLPQILCFAGQMNQVFMNILANAIDAIEELYTKRTRHETQRNSGCITISTSIVDSHWAEIVIADNGLGMSEEVRHKIFNPFFTTKPVGKGTGMGLSISYQIIVDKHGGKLDCFSKMGEGTKFIIQIPLQ
ncbi:HAMP domain-containing histidine kinase [Aetokthonos hydrillicola Thurmond2011]|jgi:signal transduction histidine kinase|uniref:histidine kinase n=1 Tax=Aetokthonos hydrillicola Thurmond2011 TaxID=2712845 RepID=A0AAP5I5F5_9CYAN|nr:ATP-binding protein [Aetokthonos hydrillicola]MBO3463770.1 sensor histidine kinase [Aetokthonos hydrillicola CCALA 1050]MBW4584825.1 HAMP domain-containing histidine kinase [Aetokthonos hydrillicola CCALA 1050]MDR9895372.1 HAMP domain-containing histidine kinase [Aetokthonos hydrillicola Thurmond2011]